MTTTPHHTPPLVHTFPAQMTGLTLPVIEKLLNEIDLRTVPAGYQRERIKDARAAVAEARIALGRLQSTLITRRA